jgi:PAS domain S-box-containing protein
MAARRILIAADETTTAAELAARLVGIGYDVAAIASSGHEAIDLAANTEPHLVLMDMTHHGRADGRQAAEEIHQRERIPVVFMTADEDEATQRRAGVSQPFGYVVKPASDRELRINLELALCKADATRQVHELEDRFFSISIDMLCFLDFNGYFKRLNPAWERTLGFTREELMSRPFIEFVHPDDRERTLRQNREVRGGGKALGFENRYLCKDGSYRWFLWNAAPDSPEQVIYSVARDVTERKQAEEEREQLVRKLQAALAEVRTLQEILPICSYCRKIRDDEDYWQTVEGYISRHTNTRFSHSICPTCFENEVEPQIAELQGE